MAERFRAVLISRDEDKNQSVEMTELGLDDLMEGDVTVAVEATTVNYKDGLAITGASPVVRRWPMIPGVDLAGRQRLGAIRNKTHTHVSQEPGYLGD